MINGTQKMVRSAENAQEQDTCKGASELAALDLAVTSLDAEVAASGDDGGDDESYTAIMDAGNAWFDAVGFSDLRFSMGETDLDG